LPIIVKISNKIEQSHWLQKLAELLKVSENILRESISKKRVVKSSVKAEPVVKRVQDRDLMLCEQIMAIVLKHPNNISYLIDSLSPEVIFDKDLQNLYKKLIIYYTEDIGSVAENFNYQEFYKKIEADKLADLADKLVLLAEKDFFDFDTDAIRDELIKTINFSKKNYYISRLKGIEEKIKQAEVARKKDDLKDLVEQFNELIVLLNSID